jgi:hypothetical protein
MNTEVKVTAAKLKRRKKLFKIAKFSIVIIILLLICIYAAVSFIYNGYFFTISLDKDLYLENNVIIYDNPNYKVYRSKLSVESLDFFDNISEKWLPTNLNDTDGSHNGESYVAYTFYIENQGEETVDYWDEVIIDDVVKNVDEAIRIRIYLDGEPITYAKKSNLTNEAEKNTTMFASDTSVRLEHIENFSPGDIHKYTIVIWLEGNDPDCTNNILGGELKAHMEFNSQHLESGDNNDK